MLLRSASRNGKKTALVSKGARLDYAGLCDRVEFYATRLAELGVKTGDCVALVVPNCPEFVVVFFAVMRIGAVLLPLSPSAPREELRRQMQEADARIILTDARRLPTCRDVAARLSRAPPVRDVETLVPSPHEERSEAPREFPARDFSDCPALYLFTSGSTDAAKRLCFTQRNLYFEAENFVDTMGLGADDTIIATVPFHHSYGIGNCLLDAVHQGATLVLLDGDDGEAPFGGRVRRFFDLVERENVRFFPGVPYQFAVLSSLPEARRGDLSGLKLCVSSTDMLPKATFDGFRARYGQAIRSLYGSTEAGSIAIDASPSPEFGSLGRPLANVTIEIRDDAGVSLPDATVGAIWVKSPAMAATLSEGSAGFARSVHRDGFYLTGDQGKIDASGRLFMAGRRQSFIDIAGQKVDVAEIEEVLRACPGVREAAVVGVEAQGIGARVKAVVVADDAVGDAAIRAHCRRSLPFYKTPSLIERRRELPRSSIGKVLKSELGDISGYLASVRSEGTKRLLARIAAAPARARPALYAAIVREQLAAVLDRDAESLPDNVGFVELGLDSFAAMELRARLALVLEREFPQTLAFDHPDIAAVAGFLAGGFGVEAPEDDILARLERALASGGRLKP